MQWQTIVMTVAFIVMLFGGVASNIKFRKLSKRYNVSFWNVYWIHRSINDEQIKKAIRQVRWLHFGGFLIFLLSFIIVFLSLGWPSTS